jgi:CheY-like chemotaxis protein
VTDVAKALLVDDRRENLLALEAILQGLPVQPVTVESGEAALKQLLVEDFAVILLDAQMPDMDGFEVASHIKRRERTRHVPIIFLTAADRDAQLALRGYAVGAVDYLTKPFDPWVLRAKVSIFVDLWTKTKQLQRQAEAVREREIACRRLTASIAEAESILRGRLTAGGPAADDSQADVQRAIEVLARARGQE